MIITLNHLHHHFLVLITKLREKYPLMGARASNKLLSYDFHHKLYLKFTLCLQHCHWTVSKSAHNRRIRNLIQTSERELFAKRVNVFNYCCKKLHLKFLIRFWRHLCVAWHRSWRNRASLNWQYLRKNI